jgi:hypothetical protein
MMLYQLEIDKKERLDEFSREKDDDYIQISLYFLL